MLCTTHANQCGCDSRCGPSELDRSLCIRVQSRQHLREFLGQVPRKATLQQGGARNRCDPELRREVEHIPSALRRTQQRLLRAQADWELDEAEMVAIARNLARYLGQRS